MPPIGYESPRALSTEESHADHAIPGWDAAENRWDCETRLPVEAEVGGGLPGEGRGRRPISRGTYCQALHPFSDRVPRTR